MAIERNNVTIATITPPQHAMTASQALSSFQIMLTPKQAADWQKDSKGDFDQAIADPWG